MPEDRSTKIKAVFETREAADLAIEHLVQQHGISLLDILLQPSTDQNSSDGRQSGGDWSHEFANRQNGALGGEIEVFADIPSSEIAKLQRTLGDAGAIRVSGACFIFRGRLAMGDHQYDGQRRLER